MFPTKLASSLILFLERWAFLLLTPTIIVQWLFQWYDLPGALVLSSLAAPLALACFRRFLTEPKTLIARVTSMTALFLGALLHVSNHARSIHDRIMSEAAFIDTVEGGLAAILLVLMLIVWTHYVGKRVDFIRSRSAAQEDNPATDIGTGPFVQNEGRAHRMSQKADPVIVTLNEDGQLR